MKTVSIHIKGKVQGVFFRRATKEKAGELGVTGEVQNLSDGSVKVLATGTEEQLSQLINWCYKGPPKALVESIETVPLPLQIFPGFIIIRN